MITNQPLISIADTTPYYLYDIQTKTVLAETTYKNRKRLRNKAEKMNLEYGAHRYNCSIVKLY